MAKSEPSSRANAEGLCHPKSPERRRIRRMDSSSGELWYVKLADGDVHRVTLDQLDEAFQAGHIDGDTIVLDAGRAHWKKLGELAGIDDDAVPIEAAPVQQLGYPAPAGQQVAAAYAQTQA